MKRARTSANGTRDDGFALVSVIWLATLLAVIGFVFTSAVRSHVREAQARLAQAEADALAEAAVNLALLRALAPAKPAGSIPPTGNTVYDCVLPGGGQAHVRVNDEAGKIDLNIASDELLRALFTGLGLSREDASSRVDAIADYRDADSNRRLNGAERQDYAEAGRTTGPANAPFEAIEDLAGVIGFDAELVQRLRPFLTVHSRKPGLDPALAPEGLVALISGGAQNFAPASAELPLTSSPLPPQFTAASTRTTFSILAEIQTPRGARFVREAVVQRLEAPVPRAGSRIADAGPPAPMPYRIWRWRRAEAASSAPLSDPAAWPAC